MGDNLHRLSGRMKSIEEGVTYFRGFVNYQEKQEWRHIQCDEERAIREAQEMMTKDR